MYRDVEGWLRNDPANDAITIHEVNGNLKEAKQRATMLLAEIPERENINPEFDAKPRRAYAVIARNGRTIVRLDRR